MPPQTSQQNTSQPVDQQALALTHAIALTETGSDGKPDYTATGKSGETGAYQWMPGNFQADATSAGLNPTDFSPENQDKVAYSQIKKYKDQGYDPGQIASLWNSGSPNNWQNHSGTNKEGVSYNTPAYVQKVKSNYQTLTNQSSQNNSTSSRKTFAESVQNIQQQQNPTTDPILQSGNPTTPGNTGIGNAIANLTPGNKLAQGAGYGLASALGSQNGLIQAENLGSEIQGQLIKQIQADKAEGKDTSRLQSALNNLTSNLGTEGNEISDVGTGGITNGQVIGSAAGLAAVPATMYAGSVAQGISKGGGLLNSLLQGSEANSLNNPAIESILKGSTLPDEVVSQLPREDAINTLTNTLKNMPISESGGKTEQLILKALKTLNPTSAETQSILAKVGSGTYNLLKQAALVKVLGDTLGGIAHKITN